MKKLTFFFVLYAGFIFSSDKRPQLPDKIYDYYILHKKATECINLIDTINNFRPESSIHWLRVSTAFDCLAIKMQLGFRESEELKEELLKGSLLSRFIYSLSQNKIFLLRLKKSLRKIFLKRTGEKP